ncbi:MAG: hypothetical protein ABSA46_14395 [Thermodesulfovibrionales bacterium]
MHLRPEKKQGGKTWRKTVTRITVALVLAIAVLGSRYETSSAVRMLRSGQQALREERSEKMQRRLICCAIEGPAAPV